MHGYRTDIMIYCK